MSITLEREQALVESLRVEHENCLILPIQMLWGSDNDGRILVSRDGLRVYLHRRLYEAVIEPLGRRDYLLTACDTWGCQNPYHFTRSNKPYEAVWKCRNGHVYTAEDRTVGGAMRCHICRAARNARRRRGGKPNWMLETERRFCPSGHEYTPENTYLYPTPSGGVHRKCKTCARIRAVGGDPYAEYLQTVDPW